MVLAGKYMMEEFAPHTIFKKGLPRFGFIEGKKGTSLKNFDGLALLRQAHPQTAFNKAGLGFRM